MALLAPGAPLCVSSAQTFSKSCSHGLRMNASSYKINQTAGNGCSYSLFVLSRDISRINAKVFVNDFRSIRRHVVCSGSGLVQANTAAYEEEPATTVTYKMPDKLWLSQEADRLLTMQKKPGDGLLLTRGLWTWHIHTSDIYCLRGDMRFLNITTKQELFIAEVRASVTLLSAGSLRGIRSSAQVIARHPLGKAEQRADNYWRAYITRPGEGTSIEVVVDICAWDADRDLSQLESARVDVEYVSYGPHGRTLHTQEVLLPLQFPKPAMSKSLSWRKTKGGLQVLPIPTHLLCHLDDPLEVMKRYVTPHMQPGDVLAVGETPLAIMQGRFRHPRSIRPGRVARLACRPFHPTSSLATACCMQALIDIVGRFRVILAVIGAAIARLFGSRGMFYRLAGPQARLIDDVTGTLPPYDQFITLGPIRVKETVDALRAKTGCEVAVVDVNDLKRVQILGASDGVDQHKLTEALLDNPAGNADEQTPLVLVRGAVR